MISGPDRAPVHGLSGGENGASVRRLRRSAPLPKHVHGRAIQSVARTAFRKGHRGYRRRDLYGENHGAVAVHPASTRLFRASRPAMALEGALQGNGRTQPEPRPVGSLNSTKNLETARATPWKRTAMGARGRYGNGVTPGWGPPSPGRGAEPGSLGRS